MRTYFALVLLIVFLGCDRNDPRNDKSTAEKINVRASIPSDSITQRDLISALQSAGINIFKFSLGPFSKKYKFAVHLEEFVAGKKVSDKNISPVESNTYTYTVSESSDGKLYFDFINYLLILGKVNETSSMISIEVHDNVTSKIRLQQRIERKNQFYDFRKYGEYHWILNRTVPLLVYGSSWYDKKFNIERFCGANDLSKDKKETRELLQQSSHYFIISYIVSDY